MDTKGRLIPREYKATVEASWK